MGLVDVLDDGTFRRDDVEGNEDDDDDAAILVIDPKTSRRTVQA